MGIQNLLNELKPITEEVHISHLSGKKCGIDISCWLHRASYSCALALISGKPTTQYLHFTLKCIRILQRHNITPIIVFDGAQLPMKANEEKRRNIMRKQNKQIAMKHAEAGNTNLAWKYARSAVEITSDMITATIKQCIDCNIQYICSPYEADAQLGYMYKNGQIDFVITEDSDLLLYGVKHALYKFNPYNCMGDFINMDKIKTYSVGQHFSYKNTANDLCFVLNQHGNEYEPLLIHICVLSGCDYVKNLKGIGIKTAIKYCSQTTNIDRILNQLLYLKFSTAPKDYKIQFKRAVLTFRYQRVYDMYKKKMTHLNPLTAQIKSCLGYTLNGLDFLGMPIDADTVERIADGRVDARSLKPRNIGTFIKNIEMKQTSDHEDHSNTTICTEITKTPLQKLGELRISVAELKFAVEANNIALVQQRNVVHFTIFELWKQKIQWTNAMENVTHDQKMLLLIANVGKFYQCLSSH
eukprot:436738_1